MSKIIKGGEQLVAFLNGDASQGRVIVPEEIDVKAIRGRLNMTQVEFAQTFGLNIRTVQNWERGEQPQSVARAYLKVIQKNPDAVRDALHA